MSWPCGVVCRRQGATEDSWVAGHSIVRVAAQEGTECLAIFRIFWPLFLARLGRLRDNRRMTDAAHKMLAMLMEAHDRGQLTFFNTHAGLAEKRAFKVLRYLSRYTHPLRPWA